MSLWKAIWQIGKITYKEYELDQNRASIQSKKAFDILAVKIGAI